MDFAHLSVNRPIIVWLIILICLLGGLYGYHSIARLEDPAFMIKQAMVFAPYPGATALEVEQEVTEPLEIAIQQMPQLFKLTSESSPGMAEIQVTVRDEFKGAELSQIWDELRNKINEARPLMPPGAVQPIVFDGFGDVFGMMYAVVAEGYSDAEIRDMSKMIRREVLLVDGVGKVQVAGAPEEKIYVDIPGAGLVSRGLPLESILTAVANDNAVVSGGTRTAGGQILNTVIPAQVDSADAVKSVLVPAASGFDTVRLGDIATVTRSRNERPDQFIYHNGKAAFTIGISVLSSENVVAVGEKVAQRLAELGDQLPIGVALHPIYEQNKVVETATNDFLINLSESVVIVIGLLCLFMGWRAGAVVGAVLVLTVSGTIMLMNLGGIEMQRISLGALVIAMGMLVDNAIVVVEGIQIGIQRGKSQLEAAQAALKRTQWPLLGATAIGITAFSGIGLSPDSTGEFLFSLFAVVAISLLLSWVLAVTVAPYFSFWLFRKVEVVADVDPYQGRVFSAYRWLLQLGLRFRWTTTFMLIAVTLLCLVGFGFVKNAFFPAANTPLFFVNVKHAQGADMLVVRDHMLDMEKYVQALPGVEQVDTFVGQGATRFMLTYNSEQPDPAYGQFIVRTGDHRIIPGLARQIVDHFRDTNPELEVRADRIEFGPASGAKLAVRFSGPDVDQLRALADTTMTTLRQSPALREVRSDWRSREVGLLVEVDTDRAQALGVSRPAIGASLQFASDAGIAGGIYREQDRLIPVVFRAPAAERGDIQQLYDRMIWSPVRQAYIPIANVVDSLVIAPQESLIQRRERKRTITVMANPLPGQTAAEAFPAFSHLVEQMEVPRGYEREWGGEYEEAARAQGNLGAQLPLGFLVMVLITVLLFGRVRQALVIWLIVPMSVCGVVLGLLATDIPFTFTALLGFLSLSGMLIKNSIVLVDEMDKRIEEGEAPYFAVRDGAVSRLRPVLLASGTTILGMTPILADAFFQSMAMTIIGGLTFATILTLIAAPVFYSLFFGIRPTTE